MSPTKRRPGEKTPLVCRGASGASGANAPHGTDDGSKPDSPDGEEWENLKRLTRQQLEFAGWIDAVETQCRIVAAEAAAVASGNAGTGPPVRHEQLLDGVREPMLKSVPDHIKARVLKDIKDKLLASSGISTGPGAE